MDVEKKDKRIYTEQEREEFIKDYQKSGMTQKAWCEEHNICANTLHKWVKKRTLKNNMSSQNWIPVEVKPDSSSISTGFITLRIGKISVDFSPATDKKLFTELIGILVNLC